jgi:hypothetical protein
MRSVREAKTASALEELPKRVANDRDERTAEAQPGVLDDRFLMMWTLTPALAESLRRRRRGKVGRSSYVDETYIKVHGQWRYLYRAIDRSGALVEVMFSEHRDMAAAKAFFESAKMVTGITPDRVTTDGHGRRILSRLRRAA